jgi:acyl dehydratase
VPVLYLEDFAIGQKFGSGRLRISEGQIRSFATEFDPQPFHVNEAAARETLFAGLAASGWHTAALTMQRDNRCKSLEVTSQSWIGQSEDNYFEPKR